MAILHLTESEFNKTVESGPVLVDFWASWCMPCKMLAPIMEDLAEKYDGKVTIAKVDVDTEVALASRFGVMGIPTVILFKFGKEVDRLVGVQPMEQYEAMLS